MEFKAFFLALLFLSLVVPAMAIDENTTTGVSWDGLPESTDITFSSKTCEFVNITSTTDACAVPPVSDIICSFVNTTAESIRANSTSWNITMGNVSWGTLIVNATQGNISYWSCVGTPTPTPTWTPEINPPSPDSLIGTIKNWVKTFLKDVFG